MVRLGLDAADEEAFGMLCGLIASGDPGIRRHALWCGGNGGLAERLVDVAIDRLSDADPEVRGAAMRLLGGVSSARERTLPLLRAALAREQAGSSCGQRAAQVIERLEAAGTSAGEGKR